MTIFAGREEVLIDTHGRAIMRSLLSALPAVSPKFAVPEPFVFELSRPRLQKGKPPLESKRMDSGLSRAWGSSLLYMTLSYGLGGLDPCNAGVMFFVPISWAGPEAKDGIGGKAVFGVLVSTSLFLRARLNLCWPKWLAINTTGTGKGAPSQPFVT